MNEEGKLMPMRELEKATGFSRATINYYIKEGLLPKPKKSAKNMAYYDYSFITKLNIIKKMRQEKNLSIKRIKSILQATSYGIDLNLLIQTHDNISQKLTPCLENSPITLNEVIKESGVSEKLASKLVSVNLLVPVSRKSKHSKDLYHPNSIAICSLINKIISLGIPLRTIQLIAEKLSSIVDLELNAFLNYVQKPMFERNVSQEEQFAAMENCIEFINTLSSLLNIQMLTNPFWSKDLKQIMYNDKGAKNNDIK